MKVVVTRSLAGGVGLLEADPRITDLWIAPPGIGPDRGEFIEQSKGAAAVLCQFRETIDAAFFDAVGSQLQIVANYAVGFENIDIKEATTRGVWVTNTPNAVTPSTADAAWALMLGVSRRLHEGERDVREGNFAARTGYDPCYLLGGDFENQTLLIVGAGRIGYATAKRSLGWDMKILYVARTDHLEFESAPLNATRVSLSEGLAAADYVSLHTPLTDETRHIIGHHELQLMKQTAYLINTARGQIVDEGALVDALRSGDIAGAGLDVYENEPTQAAGLCKLPNVCLLPHIGSASRLQRPLMTRMAQDNIIAVFDGKRPPHALNHID